VISKTIETIIHARSSIVMNAGEKGERHLEVLNQLRKSVVTLWAQKIAHRVYMTRRSSNR
jgi:hypothetical protein